MNKKCNKCGREYENNGLFKDNFYNPMLHKFTVTFSYGSTRDGEQWDYYKCENCLIEELEHFCILPKIDSYELFN